VLVRARALPCVAELDERHAGRTADACYLDRSGGRLELDKEGRGGPRIVGKRCHEVYPFSRVLKAAGGILQCNELMDIVLHDEPTRRGPLDYWAKLPIPPT
jgi:hypothetical protein